MAIETTAAARRGDNRHQPHRPRPRLSRLRPSRSLGPQLRLLRVLRPARGRVRPRRASARLSRPPSSRPGPPALALPRAPPRRRPRDAASPSAARRSSKRRRLGDVARRRPPAGQGRHAQPDPLVQGPRRRDRDGQGPRVRPRRAGLRQHRQPRRRDRRGRGRRRGLPAYVFVPADLEPAKIEHALAYGATVVPDRRHLRRRQPAVPRGRRRAGWGPVNVNLRPFYAEGSKTLAYEIAEALGWRLPTSIVAPIASGAMLTRAARAFEELVELGWVEAKPSGSSADRPPAARRSRPRGPAAATPSRPSGRRTRSSARSRSATRPMARTRSSSPGGRRARSRRSTTRRRPRPSGAPRASRASTPRRRAA